MGLIRAELGSPWPEELAITWEKNSRGGRKVTLSDFGFWFVVAMIPGAIYVVPGLVIFGIINYFRGGRSAERWIGYWFRPVMLVGEGLAWPILWRRRRMFEEEFDVAEDNPATQERVDRHVCYRAAQFYYATVEEAAVLARRRSFERVAWQRDYNEARAKLEGSKHAFWSVRKQAKQQGFDVFSNLGEYVVRARGYSECWPYLS